MLQKAALQVPARCAVQFKAKVKAEAKKKRGDLVSTDSMPPTRFVFLRAFGN